MICKEGVPVDSGGWEFKGMLPVSVLLALLSAPGGSPEVEECAASAVANMKETAMSLVNQSAPESKNSLHSSFQPIYKHFPLGPPSTAALVILKN